MTAFRYFSQIVLVCSLFSGCATVPLESTKAEKLNVEISLLQEETQLNVDVRVKHGFWNQPVSLSESDAFMITESGQTISLRASNQDGRYGYRGPLVEYIDQVQINSIGTTDIPFMAQVNPTGLKAFDEQRFSKDDQLMLALAATQAGERVLVAEAMCRNTPYVIKQDLPTNEADVELALHDILIKLNRSAEANLIGTIPIRLRIEERYEPELTAPFVAEKIAAIEEANFLVDTANFRFKASFGISVSDNFFLTLANDEYKDKFCR